MGTSLSGIHIFSDSAPVDCGYGFRSFSPNWQTCVDDLSEKEPDEIYQAARFISRHTDAPVLHFGVFDSEMIWFEFLRGGKVVSRYSDDEFVSNKKLFDIPQMTGYGDGQKRRLSSILQCADIDLKIAMLEEYLGVCLLFVPEISDEPEMLRRERGDRLYQEYLVQEKALTGKAAPIHLNLIAEYPGKLFWDFAGRNYLGIIKPHCFLYGYAQDDTYELLPVRFTGKNLEPLDLPTFSRDRIRRADDPYFLMEYGTPDKVTFSDACPPAYRGKTMAMPNGFYPAGFTKADELLLEGNHRICVVDAGLKVIARLSIKGDIADILDDGILTTTGDSFCGYCYEPKAKIRVYEIVRKANA